MTSETLCTALYTWLRTRVQWNKVVDHIRRLLYLCACRERSWRRWNLQLKREPTIWEKPLRSERNRRRKGSWRCDIVITNVVTSIWIPPGESLETLHRLRCPYRIDCESENSFENTDSQAHLLLLGTAICITVYTRPFSGQVWHSVQILTRKTHSHKKLAVISAFAWKFFFFCGCPVHQLKNDWKINWKILLPHKYRCIENSSIKFSVRMEELRDSFSRTNSYFSRKNNVRNEVFSNST